MSPLRGLVWWDYSYDVACGGRADGWGERACAAALTVGKDLCTLSIRGKCEDDAACGGRADGWGVRARAAALTVGLIFWLLFDHSKK